MRTSQESGAVIHLDLRAGAAELDTAQALRARVARRLGRAGLPEPDDPLFLVVDTPAGLTDHQQQYELLTGYRAVGEVRLLVLLVGSAPGSYADEGEAFRPDRRLVRPAVLRASGVGLLWAGDLRSARTALERPAPDDPDALAVLVDLLSVPDLYLEVLRAIGSLPEAVAAPGIRLLEQDLPAEVRDQAWRDALIRFAGEDTELPPDVLTSVSSCAGLPEPLRALVAFRGRDRPHREPGGRADTAYRDCADALDHAEDSLAGLRQLPGLLRPARRQAFDADVDEARRALDAYREVVAMALRGGGGAAPTAAESAARLTALGLRVPSAEGVGERIGEGLKEFAGKLLAQGLPLRAVAQRFTGLAGRVEPVPGSALLPRLAALPHPRPGADADGAAPGTEGAASSLLALAAVPAAGAGLLGALWHGWYLALALVVPLLFTGVAVLGAARLRDAGRPGRWAVAPRIGAFGGAVAGAALAHVTEPPVWMSCAGLLLALGVAEETARRLWRTAAASWAPGAATAALRRTLDGLDALLAEAVQEHWAVEERLYCADAARSAAGMLRAAADAAEAEALPEPERRGTPTAPGGLGVPDDFGGPGDSGDQDGGASAGDDWLSRPSALHADGTFADADDGEDDWASEYAWREEPPREEPAADEDRATDPAGLWQERAEGVPRWLDRDTGEGGPELVATLAGDLRDAALVAMDSYWRAVERGRIGTRTVQRTEERVRELLYTARRHLRQNGVLAPPPFAAAGRVRAGSAQLLGTDPQRPAELVGAEADRQAVVQLSSPEQGALLSRDPAAAVWIRFAPRAVRDEVEKAWRTTGVAPPEEVLWTSSGRYAGLLRLTPLRMGVVDTVRSRRGAGADDDWTAPYGRRDDQAASYGRLDGEHW
ncbi:hypothetical protein [Streptomyces echinoruber]|uniref:Uncharacterized protein n=1 Tax=Streptomyces echinoruber TaxID=68898 RepID=A0A918R764_9ACTN|nr:hypothetical protein [Streptomyces echinoruber]GGZ87282.1 hypothetical protein GCM10010389_27050 [Streptomyces echinoruber]